MTFRLRGLTDLVLQLDLGDVVRLRRPHPCGGYDWQVVRLGADIGLRCLGCGRRVMLERPLLEKRLQQFVFRSREAAAGGNPFHD
jgi:hypothetical protein